MSASSREPLSRYSAGSLPELLAVALPLIISAGSHAVMMFFDRLFLARHSADAFAASLPAGVIIWTLLALPLGIVAYATTFVAQYHGAGNREMVRRTVWQAIGAALVFGALQVIAGQPMLAMFEYFGHTKAVAAEERIYFEVMIWVCPVRLFVAALAAFFNGRGRTKVVMCGSLFGCGLNIILDAAFIFGLGPFPEWGIYGAAFATVVSMSANAAFLLAAIVWENRHDKALWMKTARFDRELSGRMLRYGTPQGFQFLFDIGSFTVVVLLVGRISQEALGATNLALQINSMLFVPLIGLGQAISTIVGHRIGEENPELAIRSVRMSMSLGLVWTLPFIAVFVFKPDWTLWPFEQFAPETLRSYGKVMPTLLWFVAAYSAFDLMAVVYGASIRGAGDTKFSLWVFLVINWGVMVVPLVALELANANTLMRSWFVITTTIGALGVTFWLRFRAGQWKSMSVIEPNLVSDDELPDDEAHSDQGAPSGHVEGDHIEHDFSATT